jgi:hypothetical protein
MGRVEKKLVTKEEWEKKLQNVKIRKEDMNKLVMNFLVTEGYVEAAETFEKESGTSPGVDLSSIADRTAIRKAVQSGDVEDAIERVNDLNPEILEERAHLFFHLQQQRLIELIRAGSVEEALEFAQEYLAPRGEENVRCCNQVNCLDAQPCSIVSHSSCRRSVLKPKLVLNKRPSTGAMAIFQADNWTVCAQAAFLEELERTIALLAFEDATSSPVRWGGYLTSRASTRYNKRHRCGFHIHEE